MISAGGRSLRGGRGRKAGGGWGEREGGKGEKEGKEEKGEKGKIKPPGRAGRLYLSSYLFR